MIGKMKVSETEKGLRHRNRRQFIDVLLHHTHKVPHHCLLLILNPFPINKF